ncbi:MAG TPA: class I SAM-dependent methyltransferase [Anaerolineales bacterium]
MNYFVYESVAERYAKYRPYFHPLVMKKIEAYLQLINPLAFALDVGCGAGQSALALKSIADFVVGADISVEMLRFAERRPGIDYIQAPAEQLPIKSDSADLLTTSLAYHWFDPQHFFAGARRILKDNAWMIIYNNWFAGQMKEEPGFEQWASADYEQRYPSPPRNSAPMTHEFARQHGFAFVSSEEYQNEIRFTVEELAAYLMTQSNVIAVTEQGNETLDEVHDWLIKQTRLFFKSERATFLFGGFIWYLQKTS